MMSILDLAKKIGSKVPILGTLLTGGSAGAVVKDIAKLFRVKPEAYAIEEALAKDPEAYVKLKTYALDNYTKLEEMRYKDIDSARSREVKITEVKGHDWALYIVGGIVCIGFFVICIALATTEILDDSQSILNTLLGFLGASFVSVVQYYFGSSKGSSDKTKMITSGGE
jgi:hypothetical protein